MLEGSDSEATLLETLLQWTVTDSHWLAHPPSTEPVDSDLQAVVGEVLSALHVHHHPDHQRKNDTQALPASPSTHFELAASLASPTATERMADGEGFEDVGIRRSRSWSSKGREVTWDEMGSLGLHKALNEYYKMTTPKPVRGSCRQRGRGAAGRGSALGALLCATVVRPVPFFLTPEALSAAASWVVYALALLLYHTAVITIPVALWLAASSLSGGCGKALQLPPPLLAAAPALKRLQLARLPSAPLLLAALLLFLAALRASERVICRAANARAARAARALRPQQLEERYAGWELPSGDSRQGDAGQQEAERQERQRERQLLQRVAQEAAAVCDELYGVGSCPQDLGDFDAAAALVLRMCNDAGVHVAGSSRPSPETLLMLLQQAKQAIGLQ